MAASDVEIANSALAKVGGRRITSLNDTNEVAKIVKEQYAKVRDDLLYSHPWNFAIARSALAASVTTPISEWDNQFPLPADCLRVIGTDLFDTDQWKVEGRNLMANSEAVTIKYIKKVTDVTLYTPAFCEVLACKLAADISYSLTQNATLRQTLQKDYADALRTARSFDAQESQGDRVYADSWLNAYRS